MDLRAAIERNELELYYQPLIDLRTQPGDRLRGIGALASSGTRKRSAGGFIPVAEDSG